MLGNAAETSGKWRPEEEVDDTTIKELFGESTSEIKKIDKAILGALVMYQPMNNAEIGAAIGRGCQTVSNHISQMLKLAQRQHPTCRDRYVLGEYAFRLGLPDSKTSVTSL